MLTQGLELLHGLACESSEQTGAKRDVSKHGHTFLHLPFQEDGKREQLYKPTVLVNIPVYLQRTLSEG